MGLRQPVIAVFDAGTGGGRCAIFNLSGTRLAFSYCPWEYQYPIPSRPEIISFDPSEFWRMLVDSAKRAFAELDLAKFEVVALSATAQREGIVLLDSSGDELYGGPNIDGRGRSFNRFLAEQRGDEIYRSCGHWPEEIFAPGRLHWFYEHEPELYPRISKVLSINDWIIYRLCGKYVSEPTNAAETLFFDITSRSWNGELMSDLDINRAWFPPVVPCGTAIGGLRPDVASELGIPAGIPVVVGAADTQAALLGSNVTKVGQVCVVAGSTTPVQQVQNYAQIDTECRIWTSCHIPPNQWVLEANARKTGLLYRKLVKELYNDDYDAVAQDIMKVPAGSFGTLAFLGPVLSDVKHGSQLHSSVINLQFSRGDASFRAVLLKSFLESIAYAIKANVELLDSITNMKPEQITACGGGIQTQLSAQLLADVLEIPVLRVNEPQTAALGAAICAALGIGVYADIITAAEAMAAQQQMFVPNEDGQYAPLYNDWLKWYFRLGKSVH